MNVHNRHINHLVNRATFGPSPKSIRVYQALSIPEAVDRLLMESEHYEPLLPIPTDRFKLSNPKKSKDDFKAKRKLKRKMVGAKKRFNFYWLMKMAHGQEQLRERLAFFWHDHFACNEKHPLLVQRQINTLRKHALGYFGDLVVELSKDPAMILYLNSKQNVKDRPNENFGRELLELFTIGIGKYSEKDIKEASRAFTGYRFDTEGNFYIDESKHDNGSKQFMGQTGHFKGDDIIDILLRNPETGKYVAGKLYHYFTGQEIGMGQLEELSNYFYHSGYHIGKLVKYILTSEVFYADQNIGTKIKSPVELLASMMRITEARPSKGSFTLGVQNKLKQTLLRPPNVSGWRSGKAWVDLSTIPDRLKLAQQILSTNLQVKDRQNPLSDEGDEDVLQESEKNVKIKTRINPLKKITNARSAKKQVHYLGNVLFMSDTDHLRPLYDRLASQFESGNLSFSELVVSLLSLPEYQIH